MKRVLVTGGAGFIGSHVSEAFIAAGWEVEILDNIAKGMTNGTNAVLHPWLQQELAAVRKAGLSGPAAEGAVAVGSLAVAVEVFSWSERNSETALAKALRRPGYEIQRLVGRAAAAHLLAQGRRRIGVIVPEEPGLEAFSQPRLDGVRTAVRTVEGCSVAELPLAYTEDSAARLVDGWRSLGLDGVFAYNDEYAMLLMRALQDEGITVPDDIAVVGADDLMLARLLRPRLSSVRIELPSGRSLAELVDRVVREPGGRAEVHDVLGASVVHRESS